ncbi:GntR family transcriptional regulator [Streptomyces sp. LZ34]
MAALNDDGILRRLEDDRGLLARVNAAEQVADVLRTRILEGLLSPGTRLSEHSISTALGISRNTLREAFRLLSHERLLVHHAHRGVFVRDVTAEDARRLYQVRRVIEGAAIREVAAASDAALAAIDAVERECAEEAAEGRWRETGSANMRFHLAVTDLAGNPRMTEIMRGVLAEVRLMYHIFDDRERFQKPYVPLNRQVCDLLLARRGEEAERAMVDYLRRAEAQIVEEYARLGAGPEG